MINLEKKQPISLTKQAPGLNEVKVGLSWDDTKLNGQSPDADASLFMLGENGKIPSDEFIPITTEVTKVETQNSPA